jgi:serine/threonine-protein kinase ULK4
MRGTPCYMAPELFSEGATHSTASDLWAVGCVLYECSMGRPPFLNSSFNQLVHEILNNEPQPIPGMSVDPDDLYVAQHQSAMESDTAATEGNK